MQYTVKNDTPFQILTSAIVIGPSQTGYQLEVAADGKNFSPLFTVGANVTRQATNLSSGAYYRLNGNVGDVIVNWVRSCVTEGGGGDMSNYYTKDETDEAIQEAISGISLDGYWDSGETKTYVDSADTAILAEVGGLSAVVQEQQIVFSSGYNELHTQVQELSARTPDLSAYALSADVESLSAATMGKADAASIEPNVSGHFFPTWTRQGIITGKAATAFTNSITINGVSKSYWGRGNGNPDPFYAPNSAGTAGDILVSTGNGAPVWSAITFPAPDVDKAYVDSAITGVEDEIAEISGMMQTKELVISTALNQLDSTKVGSASISTIWSGTQGAYDALTNSGATADPSTFYIILPSA